MTENQLWAVRTTYKEGQPSSVGNPYLTDDEVERVLWSLNGDAHGKLYTAELPDGTQWANGENPKWPWTRESTA
jgi:hypothetical protein